MPDRPPHRVHAACTEILTDVMMDETGGSLDHYQLVPL